MNQRRNHRDIRKYLETNGKENKNTTHKNYWDAEKQCYEGNLWLKCLNLKKEKDPRSIT